MVRVVLSTAAAVVVGALLLLGPWEAERVDSSVRDTVDTRGARGDAGFDSIARGGQDSGRLPRLKGSAPSGRRDPWRESGVLRCLVCNPGGTPRPSSILELRRCPGPDDEFEGPARLRGSEACASKLAAERGTSDSRGQVVFSDLMPGTYEVRAASVGGLIAPRACASVDGASVGLTLMYRCALDVQIQVVDTMGLPVASACVELRAQCDSRVGTTDGQGLVFVTELCENEAYEIVVRAPPERGLLVWKESSWFAMDTRVELADGRMIAGRVVDERGRPLLRAVIRARVEGEWWRTFLTEADGAFSIRGLKPGRFVELRAGLPGTRVGEMSEPLTLWPGTRDALVRLPLEGALVVHIVDWPSTARGELRATAHGACRFHTARVNPDGRCLIGGLMPGETYLLWGTVCDDERFVYHPDARAQTCAGTPLELELQRGQDLSVRIDAPSEVLLTSLLASRAGTFRRVPIVDPSSREYEIRGLPSGYWEIRARGRSRVQGGACQHWVGHGSAVTRGGSTITLEPMDPP